MDRSDTAAARRTQSERSAESAQRLVAAAIELIAEKGFERTKVGEIGERAGYSREMVRNRYGSKEQLLEALMENEYKARLLPTDDAGRRGLERALAPLALMREMAEANPELLRAFFVLCFESVGPLPQLAPWMQTWFADYRAYVATALRDGHADGSVRADVNPDTEAHGLIVHGAGLGFCWTLQPDSMDFATALDEWMVQLAARWTT